MKQNERILVYLVTGFLAVILVAAVFFGQDGKPADKKSDGATPKSFAELMGAKTGPEQAPVPAVGDGGKQATDAGGSGGPGSAVESAANRPPLVAQQVPAVAERIAQYLGANVRERDWRRVTAREGDSLEALVRRWCGTRDPFLEDAKSVNEDKLVVLRPGDAVLVPWVDDDKVWAAYEARQPKLLTGSTTNPAVSAPAVEPQAAPAADGSPAFKVPGSGDVVPVTSKDAVVAPVAGTSTYRVKANDSLWKIAAGIRGKGQAEKVLGEIRQLNPGISDRLMIDQKIVVPAR